MATIEQTPGELDLTVVQGDDLNLIFSIDQNLSGYSTITSIHPINAASNTSVTSTIVASASSSTITLNIAATTTAALDVTGEDGAHNWKMVLVDTGSLTRTIIKGSFTVLTKI
jgi:hypothetical protein